MSGAELLAVPMRAEAGADQVYSGVARRARTLWCALHRARPGGSSASVVVIVHPSSNFMGHYALAPFAAAGVDAVGMTTRYLGNDSALLLENCVLDIADVLRHLRELEYAHIVLMGNSGGGGLAALYQNQAEHPTITQCPGGGGPDLTAAELPPADALVLAMAHPGRAQLLTEWLDPAVRDEHDPFDRDPELDLFAPGRTPPYPAEFVARYRAAQLARNERLTDHALALLAEARGRGVPDLPLLIHGVCADPRFLDLALDASDREPGTLWGEPWAANLQPSTLGHYTTARSWLSQWSLRCSHGDGPARLRTVRAPVHVVYGTADRGCFPSHARELFDAVPHGRKALTPVPGGSHYLDGQPEEARRMVEVLVSWAADQRAAA